MTSDPIDQVPDPPLLWWGVIAVKMLGEDGKEEVTEHRSYAIGALTEMDAIGRLEEYRLLYSGGFSAEIRDGPWPMAQQIMQVSSTRSGRDDLNEPSRWAGP
jgi:hypothetical protein